MSDTEALRDLLERADKAAESLDVLASDLSQSAKQRARLTAKADGVRLVISYIEEALRISAVSS